ncbi:hypothetical protein PHLGIDRAFT_487674 [Phlebiopsis gigantea 11061_1 CR5-6]|uniref:RRM domain-containing protein n=1 Tax=Phlebiopsis gigantea (strain 11061_1 CR5-6) TaxID=745531 RepID=A0A0C3RW37_PHLG1|nr:hypothetical protein PHLGIDRAFT_487674 [Phlebiopsis gigantea 11061_1 CR5-6]
MSKLTVYSRFCTNILTSSRRALEITPQGPKQPFVLRRLAHRGRDALRNKSLEPQVAGPPRRRTTLRLRGIPPELTTTKITEVFSRFGNVKDCVITGDPDGKPTGHAFVEYYLPDHAEDALRASKLKDITIHGQPIDVAFFKRSLTTVKPSRTLHVSEIPLDISLSQVKSFFECHGPITNVRFGRYPGSAYIDFESTKVAQGAMQQYQATPFTMSDRVLTVYYAQPSFTVARPEENDRAAATVPRLTSERRLNTPTSSVFVTKFAKPMLESDIREAFKSFGEVQSVTLNYYEDRPSRTIAFVRFANIAEAAMAIEAWQSGALQHLGQNLRMDYELDPTRRGNRPYHTLRLSGFSGGLPILESIAEEFKESVWRVSERTSLAKVFPVSR